MSLCIIKFIIFCYFIYSLDATRKHIHVRIIVPHIIQKPNAKQVIVIPKKTHINPPLKPLLVVKHIHHTKNPEQNHEKFRFKTPAPLPRPPLSLPVNPRNKYTENFFGYQYKDNFYKEPNQKPIHLDLPPDDDYNEKFRFKTPPPLPRPPPSLPVNPRNKYTENFFEYQYKDNSYKEPTQKPIHLDLPPDDDYNSIAKYVNQQNNYKPPKVNTNPPSDDEFNSITKIVKSEHIEIKEIDPDESNPSDKIKVFGSYKVQESDPFDSTTTSYHTYDSPQTKDIARALSNFDNKYKVASDYYDSSQMDEVNFDDESGNENY